MAAMAARERLAATVPAGTIRQIQPLRRRAPARETPPDRGRGQSARAGHGLAFARQPIRGAAAGRVIAYEVLARPAGIDDTRSREGWFAAMEATGGIAWVDAEAVGAASALRSRLAATANATAVSCNGSLRSLGSAAWWAAIDRVVDVAPPDASPLVVELTERCSEIRPGALEEAARALRNRGVWICLDDVGDPAGQHVLALFERLRPDWVKLSGRLMARAVHGGRTGASRAEAELAGYVARARGIGAMVVAEGIENPRFQVLAERLGVDALQGFWSGEPADGMWVNASGAGMA